MKLIRFSFVIVACLWLSCGTIEERRRQVEKQQAKQAVENQEYSSASVQEQQVKSTKQNTNTTEIKAENSTNNTKYYVVVGSFSRVEEAKELYSQLVDNKYSCDILTADNGYHRVVLGSYINRNEARNAKDLFAATYQDVEPWILTQ